jgi:Domain of unknown function (DUF4421)
MKKSKFIFFILTAIVYSKAFLHAETVVAQYTDHSVHDTTFYEVYPGKVTTRFYFSQKYTSFTVQAPGVTENLKFRPNTTLNMGIGATYHNFSLNLAYGFGFLNNDTEKGETKYLDLQTHYYPGKWSIDFFGQFYKGYYLMPKGYASNSPGNYYQRPDLDVTHVGLAAYRILNNKKFSYNAAIVQNEWQKKSAGSFLVGGEMYYTVIKGDSALVPRNIENGYPQAGINKIGFFSFGPGLGYAYTLVVQKHFFITGSLTVNLNLGFSTESAYIYNGNATYVNPASIYRFAAGYNSRTWNVSVNWIGNRVPFRGESTSKNYLLQTGNYRIILSKKIDPGKKLKKLLAPIDKLLR